MENQSPKNKPTEGKAGHDPFLPWLAFSFDYPTSGEREDKEEDYGAEEKQDFSLHRPI
jgi:hypothetical protein